MPGACAISSSASRRGGAEIGARWVAAAARTVRTRSSPARGGGPAAGWWRGRASERGACNSAPSTTGFAGGPPPRDGEDLDAIDCGQPLGFVLGNQSANQPDHLAFKERHTGGEGESVSERVDAGGRRTTQ